RDHRRSARAGGLCAADRAVRSARTRSGGAVLAAQPGASLRHRQLGPRHLQPGRPRQPLRAVERSDRAGDLRRRRLPARAGGRLMFRHILPNAVSPIIVQATLDLGYIILTAAALSFIGFGAQPGEPDWGRMVADGRQHMRDYWWIVTFPGLAIFFSVMAFNL